MKMLPTLLLWAAAVAAAGSTVQAQTSLRVAADNVNLRAKPQFENSEVLAQAQYGDQLTSHGTTGEWFEVSAPDSVSLWVSQEFVQRPENTINTKRVNLRAGPSINYNIVATLDRGASVQVADRYGMTPLHKAAAFNRAGLAEMLLDKGVMYYLGGVLTPYSQHQEAGRFEVKTGTSETNGHAFSQARFTAKGVQWVAGLWAAYQIEVVA